MKYSTSSRHERRTARFCSDSGLPSQRSVLHLGSHMQRSVASTKSFSSPMRWRNRSHLTRTCRPRELRMRLCWQQLPAPERKTRPKCRTVTMRKILLGTPVCAFSHFCFHRAKTFLRKESSTKANQVKSMLKSVAFSQMYERAYGMLQMCCSTSQNHILICN